MKHLAIILLFASFAAAGMRSSIEHNGVTWQFDTAYPCGQYAGGDWWVAGPVVITAISPDFNGDYNGWEVNPPVDGGTGFDSRIGGFDAARVPSLPYTAQPGQSLIKGVSVDASDTGCRPCLKGADVLTVVSAVPADSGGTVFRPPYVSAEKPVYSTTGLRTDLLPSLAGPPVKPTLQTVADNYARVRPDHKSDYRVRYIHPSDHMPDYGSSMAIQAAEAVLRLSLDDPVQDKMPAVIGLVQNGIDLYHITKSGRNWVANGGQGWGRTLAQLFAGVLLDDRAIKDFITNSPVETYAPGQAVFFSQKADSGKGKVLYGEPSVHFTEKVYWQKVIDHNATGSKHGDDPYGYIDGGVEPGGSYQYCCASMPMKQIAIALHVFPELKEVWDDDMVIRYADRWVDHGAWTQPDPCAPAETTMDNYGITFGPDPDNPGDCIRDTDPSDGIGRFPERHGVNADAGSYGSTFANFMWTWYRDSTFSSAVSGYPDPVNGVALTFPSPCRFGGTVGYRVPERSGAVSITIYGPDGTVLAAPVSGGHNPGYYRFTWPRKAGRAGVYYLAVRSGAGQTIHLVAVIPWAG